MLFSAERGGIWLVAIIGLSLSLAALLLIQQQLEAHKMLDFEWTAHNRIRAIDHGIDNSLLAMKTMRDFYMASEHVESNEFKTFAQPLLERHPGIQALLWVPRVVHAQRGQFEASQSSEYGETLIREPGPHFDLIPATKRDEYLPVSYIAPESNTDFAPGFDLSSNPQFAAVLKRSRDSGRLAASGRIGFPTDTETVDYGFMVSLPVYGAGLPTKTPAQRSEHLAGYVVGLFRLSSLARAAISLLEPRGVEVLLNQQERREGEAKANDGNQPDTTPFR